MSEDEDMTAEEFDAAMEAGEPVELERRRPLSRIVSSSLPVWLGLAGSSATLPWEAFDVTHPDHERWYEQTGRCLAPECAAHQRTEDSGE